MELIVQLVLVFEEKKNSLVAAQQKSYMKNHFEFLGIKAAERRSLQKPFLDKKYLPPKNQLPQLVKSLWTLPQREYQYFAQELVFAYQKRQEEKDIRLFEYMITHKSWWDTVDFIATNLVGNYFRKFPRQKEQFIHRWLASGNTWLQRTAILFQLKYKTELDTRLLANCIHALHGSKEFFINKAIGWILREYSKTNPAWVRNFIAGTTLPGLSKREAEKYLTK